MLNAKLIAIFLAFLALLFRVIIIATAKLTRKRIVHGLGQGEHKSDSLFAMLWLAQELINIRPYILGSTA
jgi:hypothetical protein